MVILVADDERLVRYSLRSMLEEIDIPARSIQLAGDGGEMLEKVRAAQPDLAFVDIKMPRLDGLEAIARARALSPNTKWIILTSYSSFDFAKRAIELGAEDYLLKPVSPAELSRVVRRIGRTSRQELLHLNHEFEAYLTARFHSTLSADQGAEPFVSGAQLAAALLVFDGCLGERDLLARQLGACSLARRKLGAAAGSATRLALCTLPGGAVALVGAWRPGGGSEEAQELVYDLFRRVHAAAASGAPGPVRMTQLLSEPCRSFEELLHQLGLLQQLAPLRVVLGTGTQLQLQALRDGDRQALRLSRSLVGLSEAFRREAYLEYLKLSDEVEKGWRDWNPEGGPGLRRATLGFLDIALDFRPSHGLEGEAWLRELRRHGERFLRPAGAERPGNLAEQALQFATDNYMRNIGLAQIAFDLGITPNYLSHLFHKHTGTTFLRCVTGLRMSRARELLSDPANRVQQVARQVGYFSTRHFSRLFKRAYGVYPSEFLKSRERGRRYR